MGERDDEMSDKPSIHDLHGDKCVCSVCMTANTCPNPENDEGYDQQEEERDELRRTSVQGSDKRRLHSLRREARLISMGSRAS